MFYISLATLFILMVVGGFSIQGNNLFNQKKVEMAYEGTSVT